MWVRISYWIFQERVFDIGSVQSWQYQWHTLCHVLFI